MPADSHLSEASSNGRRRDVVFLPNVNSGREMATLHVSLVVENYAYHAVYISSLATSAEDKRRGYKGKTGHTLCNSGMMVGPPLLLSGHWT
jgi:hypothetical protein